MSEIIVQLSQNDVKQVSASVTAKLKGHYYYYYYHLEFNVIPWVSWSYNEVIYVYLLDLKQMCKI